MKWSKMRSCDVGVRVSLGPAQMHAWGRWLVPDTGPRVPKRRVGKVLGVYSLDRGPSEDSAKHHTRQTTLHRPPSRCGTSRRPRASASRCTRRGARPSRRTSRTRAGTGTRRRSTARQRPGRSRPTIRRHRRSLILNVLLERGEGLVRLGIRSGPVVRGRKGDDVRKGGFQTGDPFDQFRHGKVGCASVLLFLLLLGNFE